MILKRFFTPPAWFPDVGLLALRLGFGAYMFTHGLPKFQKVLEGNLQAFADPLGLGPAASLILAAAAETLGAALVVLGLATRPAALSLMGVMAVAAFLTHGGDPWTMGEGARLFKAGLAKAWSSKEPALLYLAAFSALFFTGAGRYSLDAWLQRKRG
jgi:putative oxidoreductase